MKAPRQLCALILFSLSLACAGSKEPTTDGGPAASAGDAAKADDGEVAEDGAESQPDEAGDEAADEGGGQACTSDADCVPAQCCHPTSCVPASEAPDCSDVACTEECRGGTMDCGQGHCACQDGTCTAVIDNPL